MKTYEVYAKADANGYTRVLGEVQALDRGHAMRLAVQMYGAEVGDVYEKSDWKPS